MFTPLKKVTVKEAFCGKIYFMKINVCANSFSISELPFIFKFNKYCIKKLCINIRVILIFSELEVIIIKRSNVLIAIPLNMISVQEIKIGIKNHVPVLIFIITRMNMLYDRVTENKNKNAANKFDKIKLERLIGRAKK